MKEIKSIEEVIEFLEKSHAEDILFYKHSFRCPICTGAMEEVESFIKENPHITIVWINVIESRDASNHLAETSDIAHQSPQVILYREGKPIWDTSHRDIKHSTLKQNIL